MEKLDLTLYFITDSSGLSEEEFLGKVESALKGGVSVVQLREKERDTRAYIELAGKVHSLTRRWGVPLIINDRVDVAAAVQAEGVHLGQSDMPVRMARELLGPGRIIGATAKTEAQAREAFMQGADYLGVGAIYPSETKEKAVRTSVETLRCICGAVPIPVCAIGGLQAENLSILRGIPIAGICVVSAVMRAEHPGKAAEKLRKAYWKDVKPVRAVLTIAGSDSSGGAGIQADLKTMAMHGVYGMSAVTALTAQNTLGVRDILEISPEFLREQLDAVFEDIVPDAVKIGMVASPDLIDVIAERLYGYGAGKIVVDPVMVATSGASLISEEALERLKDRLLPEADLITPNLLEAEKLAGVKISSPEDMAAAAEAIGRRYGCAVLVKGGHGAGEADDFLWQEKGHEWLRAARISNPNTHGTGCTLSSAIASNLALGDSVSEASIKAKQYLTGAIRAGLDLGKGAGPLMHNYTLAGGWGERKRGTEQ